MSWHFSQALVAEYSAVTCLDGERFVQSNTTPTPEAYYWPDKTTEHSRLSRFGMTSEPLMGGHGEGLLTWFLVASLAKTSALQEKVMDWTVSEAGSGQKWGESFAKYDRERCTWKTHQLSLLGGLDEYSETWPRWGSMRNGESFLRRTPALPICASGSGLWPTPNAMPASNDLNFRCSGDGRTKPNKLGWAVANSIWPTPCASASKGSSPAALVRKDGKSLVNDRIDHAVMASDGGQLNPEWVEWLMGWPIGWTELNPLETDRFQEWLQQHGGF